MELTEEQKEQVKEKLDLFLSDIIENVVKIDGNNDLANDVSLEQDYYEVLERVEEHINLFLKLNDEQSNEECMT